MKRLQAGDIDYKEASAASAIRNKIEVDGIKAEQNAAVLKVRSLRFVVGEIHVKITIKCTIICSERGNCIAANELAAPWRQTEVDCVRKAYRFSLSHENF